MGRKRPVTKERIASDILNTSVCDCAKVSDVIDEALALAMDWHEEGGCKVKQTVTFILASRLYQQLMVQMQHGGKEETNNVIAFINEMRKLADIIEDSCQRYMMETFAVEAMRRTGVPEGVTVQ